MLVYFEEGFAPPGRGACRWWAMERHAWLCQPSRLDNSENCPLCAERALRLVGQHKSLKLQRRGSPAGPTRHSSQNAVSAGDGKDLVISVSWRGADAGGTVSRPGIAPEAVEMAAPSLGPRKPFPGNSRCCASETGSKE
jgi:hypothetical protein